MVLSQGGPHSLTPPRQLRPHPPHFLLTSIEPDKFTFGAWPLKQWLWSKRSGQTAMGAMRSVRACMIL